MAFEANISLNRISDSIMNTLGIDINNYEIKEKIKFEAIQFRALLLRRDLERNPITRNFLQWICLELECKDLSDCCEVKSFKTALRTKEKIPVPLRTKDYDSFYYVGDINKMKAFKETTFDNVQLMKHRRFTSTEPLFVYDNYVWIFNEPTPNYKYLTIGSIFEDPRQLAELKNCDGSNCYTDDDYFPIGADQYPTLEEYLIKLFSGKNLTENKEIKINDN